MNFLKVRTTWSAIELGFLKISTTSAGIVLGMYFYEELRTSFIAIFGVFIFTTIVAGYLWIRKVRQED